jgi:hypothetical protein
MNIMAVYSDMHIGFLYGLCTHFKGSLAQVAAEGAAIAAEEARQRHQSD